MRRVLAVAFLSGSLALGAASGCAAQEPGSGLLSVGEMAPDFALPGATRYGPLKDPVRLSDYRGKTLVLAFFYVVRTPG